MWFLKKKKPMIEAEIGDWYFSFKRMEAWIPDSVDVQGCVKLVWEDNKLCKFAAIGDGRPWVCSFFDDDSMQKELDEAYKKYVDIEFEDIVLIGPTCG